MLDLFIGAVAIACYAVVIVLDKLCQPFKRRK